MITGPLADLVLAALALWGIGGWSRSINTEIGDTAGYAAWAYVDQQGTCQIVAGEALWPYWAPWAKKAIIGHEVGHCLGMWDHLEDCEEAPAIMCTAATIGPWPTVRDFGYLRTMPWWPTQRRLVVPMVVQ